MVEQRYQAVLAVIGDGETVTDVAARFGVARHAAPAWVAGIEVVHHVAEPLTGADALPYGKVYQTVRHWRKDA
ncbi:MAG: hypothetical protein WB797_05910 [Nocardioides sp.]